MAKWMPKQPLRRFSQPGCQSYFSCVYVRDEALSVDVWKLNVRVGMIGDMMTIGNPVVENLRKFWMFLQRP